jgi:hypothetical protein
LFETVNCSSSSYESYEAELQPTTERKSAAPHNLSIFKSYREVVLNRSFAELALRHPVAKDLLAWLADTSCPDEYFFVTLNQIHFNNADYSFTQETETPPCELQARYTRWEFSSPGLCFGRNTRHLCQFSVRDLTMLAWEARDALFVNKFNATTDALAAVCWAERVSTPRPSD